MRKHAGGTGAGPPLPPLSEMEERLLQVMGQAASVGMEELKDPLQVLETC